jgi:hypothetical protein
MKSVTFKETLEAMKAAVSEKGDEYVYERQEHPNVGLHGSLGVCLNTTPDGKKTGCIVGDVLHRLGVSLTWLGCGENINNSAAGLLSKLRHEELYDFDRNSLLLLSEAQSLQDTGTPWGEALSKAVAYVETGSHVD